MTRRELSRRNFLRWVALAAAGALLRKDQGPITTEVEGTENYELSVLEEEANRLQRVVVPDELRSTIQAEAEGALPMADRERRLREVAIVKAMNNKLKNSEKGVELGTRLTALDAGAFFGAYPNAWLNPGPLTHSITAPWIEGIPLDQLQIVGINSTVSNADLLAAGWVPGSQLRSNSRANAASHKLNLPFYGQSGGTTEVLYRGPDSASAEDIANAYWNSPPHRRALEEGFPHYGINVDSGRYGLVCNIMLGRGLNGFNWPESNRNNIPLDWHDPNVHNSFMPLSPKSK